MIAYITIIICAGILGYTYFGYPLLLCLLNRIRRLAAPEFDLHPDRVSVLVVVHNGAGLIGARIRNLLEQVHLPDSYEVVVASDGSTDATVVEAAEVRDPRVRVVAFEGRRGKSAVLSELIPQCKGDIIVLGDVRQRFAPDTVSVLSRAVCARGVGAVSGELIIQDESGSETGHAIQSYWSYEKMLRQLESGIDSTCGCTGACYALRKAAFQAIDARVILDDVAIPMRMVLAGHRVLFNRSATAFDSVCSDPQLESERKVRTLMGNLQLCRIYPELLSPCANRIWLQFVSHKMLRLLTPFAMLGVLVGSAAWALRSWLGVVLLGGQLAFYAIGTTGMGRRRRMPMIQRLPATVVMMSVSVLKAWCGFLRGQATGTWAPTRNKA
jgi:biofilm PGA synthesis N-glycosyltransferase PgaC